MGAYFSNLHIRKNNTDPSNLASFITEYFSNKGYVSANPDTADLQIALYAPEESDWMSIFSEAFTHTDILTLAPKLSEACDTDILNVACFDSDYLFVNLLNTGKGYDLWLNIGDTPEIKKPRRSGVAAWKGHVADHARFKAAAGGDYVCAEDFLREVQDDLGISFEQSTGFDLPDTVIKLYFSSPRAEEATPTKLTIEHYKLTPCEPGQRTACVVLNRGKASKGICFLFMGDYVESEEITIDNTEFFYTDRSGKSVSIPITFEKRQWAEDTWVYYWEDANFPIPPAVPNDLPPRTQSTKEGERSFGIRYVPNGNKRKFLDIAIVVAPLSNFEKGQCGWRVWARAGSKRDFIRETNESALEMREYGVPDDVIANFMLNESDYDLD